MSRRFVSGVLFLLLLSALVTAPLVTEAGEDARIRGTVLDPEGRALPGAAVSLRVPGGACRVIPDEHTYGRTVTDASGRFALPDPPGAMEFYVRHPAYAPAWTKARDASTIRLQPASWIEGVVNTPATITIARGPWHFVKERIEGRFRCGPLPPDIVLSVRVTSQTHRPFDTRIVLGEDDTRAMTVTLEQGASLSGRVFPPHEGATARAHGKDGREAVATTAADGTFTVTGLDEGWVRLVVLSPDRPVQVLDTHTGESVEVRWPR